MDTLEFVRGPLFIAAFTFMVLGLRHAADNCEQGAGRADVYGRVLEFASRFREQNGSIVCRDLLGCDISTPEGMQEAKERNLFTTTCVSMVESAATILDDMAAEDGHRTSVDATPDS